MYTDNLYPVMNRGNNYITPLSHLPLCCLIETCLASKVPLLQAKPVLQYYHYI